MIGPMSASQAVARLERVAWPLAALVWLFLVVHFAERIGPDFSAIYGGPYALLRGIVFYPTSVDPFTDHGSAWFYLHPPSAPVALAPLGLLSEATAGSILVVGSVATFVTGLFRVARTTPFPALILLGAGLSLPAREVIGLGNVDLLCAGLIALAVTIRSRYRALPLGLALAIKPIMWPLLVLFGLDALIAVGVVGGFGLVGLLTIKEVDRFFDNVIPFLASGQETVKAVRASLPDAAVAAGLPRSPIAIICSLVLLALLAYTVVRVPADRKLELAPLIVIAALLLSGYTFVPYVVYLIAVLPLLRPRGNHLVLLGVALYLIGSPDVWSSDRLPTELNTLLSFKVMVGMLLLIPIAATALRAAPTVDRVPAGHTLKHVGVD